MERFLYRLSRSVHADIFVLKGALMFTAWHAPVTRPTMDIDLLGITDNDVEAIVAVVEDIIWLLSRQFDFDGPTMAQAVTETFATRGATISADPVALTDAFAREAARQTQWQAFVRKSRLHDVPATFAEIVEAIAVFLGPITNALATSETFEGAWIAPGRWQSQDRQ